ANSNSSNGSILLGDATGNFSAPTNFTAGTSPRSVAVGDFNGDGKQDLAVANNGSNNVSILLRNCPPPALTFNSASSRGVHNGTPYAIGLPLSGTPGIECRSGDGSGDGNYSIVFSLSNPISSVDNANPNCGSLVSGGVDPGNSNNY